MSTRSVCGVVSATSHHTSCRRMYGVSACLNRMVGHCFVETFALASHLVAPEFIKINYPGSGNYSAFTYDAYGCNVKILEYSGGSLTSTKQFVWCSRHRCEARDGSGSIVNQYFDYGAQMSGSDYCYSINNIGSIAEMTNSAGVVEAQYSYDPYGRPIKLQGSLASDFQYAGYYFHMSSGLNLPVYRAYSAATGGSTETR